MPFWPLPQLSETSKVDIPWLAPAHPGKDANNQKHLLIDLLGGGWQSLTQGSTSGRKHFTLHPKSIFNSMSTRYNGKPESHRGHSGIHMERKTWKFPHQNHLPGSPSALKKQCPNFHCLDTGFLSGIFRNPLRLMIFSVRPRWRSLQKSILDAPLAFSRREVFNLK